MMEATSSETPAPQDSPAPLPEHIQLLDLLAASRSQGRIAFTREGVQRVCAALKPLCEEDAPALALLPRLVCAILLRDSVAGAASLMVAAALCGRPLDAAVMAHVAPYVRTTSFIPLLIAAVGGDRLGALVQLLESERLDSSSAAVALFCACELLPRGAEAPPRLRAQLRKWARYEYGSLFGGYIGFAALRVNDPEVRRAAARWMPSVRDQANPPSAIRQARRALSGLSLSLLPVDEPVVSGFGVTLRRPPGRVGRNDPCPCGSGKKRKRCCADQEVESSPVAGVPLAQYYARADRYMTLEKFTELPYRDLAAFDLDPLPTPYLEAAFYTACAYRQLEYAAKVVHLLSTREPPPLELSDKALATLATVVDVVNRSLEEEGDDAGAAPAPIDVNQLPLDPSMVRVMAHALAMATREDKDLSQQQAMLQEVSQVLEDVRRQTRERLTAGEPPPRVPVLESKPAAAGAPPAVPIGEEAAAPAGQAGAAEAQQAQLLAKDLADLQVDVLRAHLISQAVAARNVQLVQQQMELLRHKDLLAPADWVGIAALSDAGERVALIEQACYAVLLDSRESHVPALASAMLTHLPALGILVARAALDGTKSKKVNDLLESIEQARDRLGLTSRDRAWALQERLQAGRLQQELAQQAQKTERERLQAQALMLQEQAQASSARVAELERRLQEQEEALQAALRGAGATQPSGPAEVAEDEAERKRLQGKISRLKSLIADGNQERARLREQLAEMSDTLSSLASAAPTGEAEDEPDEPEDGLEVEDGAGDEVRPIRCPVFTRGAQVALGQVPARIAREALHAVAALCTGEAVAFRGVKRLKSIVPAMAPMWSLRVGIHHRLLFRQREGAIEVMELIHRKDLELTLKQKRWM